MTHHPYRIRNGRVVIEPSPRKKAPNRRRRGVEEERRGVKELAAHLLTRLKPLWVKWRSRQKRMKSAADNPSSFFFRVAGEWALILTVPLAILVAAAQNANVINLNKAGVALKAAFSPPIGGLAYSEAVEANAKSADVPTLNERMYEVKAGDSLYQIGRQYGLKVDTIASVNQLADARDIHPGDRLRIPSVDGLLRVVEKNDTIEDIALDYDVSIHSVVNANNISDPNTIYVGQELFLPNAKAPRASNGWSRTGQPVFARPAAGRISSHYGQRRHPITRRSQLHAGIDFACGYGAKIMAARDGVVIRAEWFGGYGNLIVLQHENGYTTRYAHLSRLKVRRGQKVRQGQEIGRAGSTGVSTGPHLHFEVRRNGKAINPLTVLK